MTKKVFFNFWLLLVLGTAILFNACSKDNDTQKPAIQVTNEQDLTQTVYADAGKGNDILITTTGAWTSRIETQMPVASSSQQLRSTEPTTWITISPDHGNTASDYTISISLAINTTGTDRTAIIVILCEGKEITITVTQRSVTAPIAVTGISLNVSALTLAIGEDSTLTATVLPENATNQTVIWTSSDNDKAIVSNGKVTAIAEGTATITAKVGNQIATCLVTVIDKSISNDINGVVINGIRWATRNVDAPGTFAAKPEDAGMFYQWNRKIGWSATDPMINSNGGTTWDSSTATGTTWEKSNDPSPAGWRVPTLDEIQTLFDSDKVNNKWTTLNGINGMKFTDKISGASLFLPAAGHRLCFGDMYETAGMFGLYWSSTAFDFGMDAYSLNLFDDGSVYAAAYFRAGGYSVRAVAE